MDALLESLADELEGNSGKAAKWAGPLDVARLVALETVQTPALDIIDAALIAALKGTGPKRLIISMPPQEGKSQRVSRFFPTWALTQNPELRIALIGYQDAISRRWGRQIRNDIVGNPQLGLRVRTDTSAANEWQLAGHDGGVITSSVAGSLTGRPVDILIIDDPHKDAKEAGSEVMQENTREWWRTAASTRMPAGGGIVIVVQTRWHEADLAGFLMAEEPGEWHMINIPAQAVHDPDRGPDCKCGQRVGEQGIEMTCIGYDILGRQPGEYMVSARGRTVKDWEQRRRNAGTRGWSALYQGWPSPAEGEILKRGWWRYYDNPRHVVLDSGEHRALGTSQVIISLDCAFKDTDGSDYVVFGVFARRGPKVWVLDWVRAKMDFERTCNELVQLAAKWPQAGIKIVEDKANGPAVITTLRKIIGGIVPYDPGRNSKQDRAYAVSPFIEAGDVELPRFAPWVGAFVHECATFPNGTHDDQVDCLTQALIRLLLEGGGGGDFMAEMEANQRRPGGDSGAGADPTYWSTIPEPTSAGVDSGTVPPALARR